MRLSRNSGWHFHLLDISGTRPAGYIFWVLRVVLALCMSGVGSVEGRPTATCECWANDCDHEHTQNQLAAYTLAPRAARGRRRPDPDPDPSNVWSEGHGSLVDPVNIALATIGAIAGVLLLGGLFYKFYTKWSALQSDPLWPPLDAPREEVVQLVELIRMGMIDAYGAPLHVINWVRNGVDAPWPPPGGVQSLQARRRRGRRLVGGARPIPRDPRGSPRGRRSMFTTDGIIELPRRARQNRQGTTRPLSASTVEPLPLYVRDAELDSNHYPITVIPQEFPPPPPEFSCSAPSGLSSQTRPEAQVIASSSGSSRSSVNRDDESESGSRRTGSLSLRENDDAPLTGLTPRPPPPAVLPGASQPRSSVLFTGTINANAG